jgi:hypothetical protein
MSNHDTITIRRAGPKDRATLDCLAGRDSTALPEDDFLLAEVAGEAWAAIGIRTGALAADPFRPSAEVGALLRIRVDRARDQTVMARPAPSLFRRLARRAAVGPAG